MHARVALWAIQIRGKVLAAHLAVRVVFCDALHTVRVAAPAAGDAVGSQLLVVRVSVPLASVPAADEVVVPPWRISPLSPLCIATQVHCDGCMPLRQHSERLHLSVRTGEHTKLLPESLGSDLLNLT